MSEPLDLWGERGRPTGRQLAFDVVAAGAFTLPALAIAGQQGAAMVAATLAMGVALAVRRLSWPAMALLAAGAGIAQLVAAELVIFTDLGYAPVCFVLGAHPNRDVRRFGLGAVTVSTAALAVAVGVDRFSAVGGVSTAFSVLGSAALAALVAGGGWAAGLVRWQNRARVSAQVVADREVERTRIAADMHDLVAHTWAVVAAQADGARYSLGAPGGQARATEALDVIAETARASIGDLRDLLAELRDQLPAEPPGRATHDALLARMRASGMTLDASSQGRPSETGLVAVTAQRVLSEALTNALKHGDLSRPVEVEEDWRDGYRLVVRNRVPHVAPGARPLGTGHGVDGMRGRVELAGGRFAVTAEGDLWTVTASVPEPAA